MVIKSGRNRRATQDFMARALPRQYCSGILMHPIADCRGIVISCRWLNYCTTDLHTDLPFTCGLSILCSLLRMSTLVVK